MSASADPRTCGACSSWHVIPGEGEAFGECGDARVAEAAGIELVPRRDFGCRFFTPADPSAYRAALLRLAAPAAYDALYGRAGRTALPAWGQAGDWTRETVEIVALRVLQAAGVL